MKDYVLEVIIGVVFFGALGLFANMVGSLIKSKR